MSENINYTTQMDAARKGIITPEIKSVAEKEHMDVNTLMKYVAEGKVAICANKNHKSLDPEGVGSMLRTKINVNLGVSRDFKDYDMEMEKVMSAVNLGAEAIMDLSSHGNTQPFRKKLTSECPAMIGTVPVYDSVIHYQRDLATLTAKDFIDVVRLHAEDGVDFVTLHCGITRKTIEQIKKHKRKMNIVSRGGSLVFAWMTMTGEENPFYDNVCTIIREATGKDRDESTPNDDILKDFHIQNIDQEILIKGDVTISFSGYSLAVGNFVNGVAFPSSEIGRIDSIDVATNKLLTIENKTAFYRFDNDEYAVMYLGGYANRYQTELIKKIHGYDPKVEFFHFGDIDMGGLFIHQHLCNSTGIHFEMLHMGIEELDAPENRNCLQCLTEADRERSGSLLEIPEYRDIVALMLEKNIKLEQEIICLNI